MSMLKYSKS